MTQKVIKVEPVDNIFSINWFMSPRCNYDCMYCSPKWHNTTDVHKPLKELQRIWENILSKTNHLELKYKIVFTGGEVTSNKHLMPFVRWLREHYSEKIFKILMSTNGSATLKYYQQLFEVVDNISFSVHSEHIDEKKFFDMIIKLSKTISEKNVLHVNIMNEFWNQDRIPKYQELLDKHSIYNSVNEIDYSYQTRSIPIFKGKLNLDIQ